jgi:two-component system, OmpR family, response regulator
MLQLRVLVVEDDSSARDLLVAILEDDGYDVLALAEGSAALVAAATFKPDLALLDSGLPGITGGDVARRLRQISDLPIIFVTAAGSAEDIRSGFKLGADDYIVKPFDPEELSWRVRAVLRRTGHAVAEVLEAGDLMVDERAFAVTRSGSPVALTAIEFNVLNVLVHNCGRVVSQGQLIGQVWGYNAGTHLLAVHVSSLRRKLEAHGPRIIHTIRGNGYILRPGANTATE